MSKFTLAKAIASKTGTSITQAMRFVNDVGVTRARQALRSAEDGVTWKLPTTAGIATGGTLWWRQQSVDRAEAEADEEEAKAEQEESAESVIRMIMNSDMDPEDKKALIDKMVGRNNDNGDDDDDSGSWLRDLLGLDGDGGLGLGDLQETVIMLIVVVVVVMFVLNYTTSMAVSAGSGGVR